ncbi:MAG: septum formation initiator family protein [Candidatus Pacebacteria bacterium]|nr:septum formation initiator family protein [Candidatus Paceibacterota bacterium]
MKNHRVSPIYIGLWIILCTAVSVSLIKHLYDISQVYRRVQTIEEKNEVVQRENAEKKKKIDESKTPFVREQMIRDELGMQKPNEKIVQIIQTPELAPSQSPTVIAQQKISLWDKISLVFSKIRGFFSRR